jgi:HAD superfamily hydrolase (TIGR01509 family)
MQLGVLWDLDGVLADSGPCHYQSWLDTLAAHGVAFDEGMFRRTFGMNNTGILQLFLRVETPQALIDQIGDEKEELFRRLIAGQLQPLPGVKPLLAALQAAGFRQAIGSSAPQANIDAELDALGLRLYFDAIVSGAGFPGKPNPQVYLQAAGCLGLAPRRCLVIEDAIPGVQAAKAAGMRSLAVTNTNSAAALSAADRVVESLETVGVSDIRRLLEI